MFVFGFAVNYLFHDFYYINMYIQLIESNLLIKRCFMSDYDSPFIHIKPFL